MSDREIGWLDKTLPSRISTLSSSVWVWDKTLPPSARVEELVKFKDIVNARQHVISKEISSVLSLDMEEISKYIEQKFRIDICHFDDWTKFKERFCRRNILIHNSGMVNRQYGLKTGYHGKLRQMIVSEQYLDESINIFEKMASLIFASFCNKFHETLSLKQHSARGMAKKAPSPKFKV